MLIEDGFTLPEPPERLWTTLLDVEKVATCVPGAELTETVDDRTWKGKVGLRFGAVSMTFVGTVAMTERDDATHRVALEAKGVEQRGKGAANATVTVWLEPSAEAEATSVRMRAEVSISGVAAQMSRGLIPEVSRKLTRQFAERLEATMIDSPRPAS